MDSDLVSELLTSQQRIEGKLEGLSAIETKLQGLSEALEEMRCSVASMSASGLQNSHGSGRDSTTSMYVPEKMPSACNSLDKGMTAPTQTSEMRAERSMRRTGKTARTMSGKLVAYTLPRGWPGSLRTRRLAGNSVMVSDEDMQAEWYNNHMAGTQSLGRAISDSSDRARKCLFPKLRDLVPIDPNSNFGMVSDVLCLLVLIVDLTSLPYFLAWEVPPEGNVLIWVWFSSVFWTLDILRTFLTGIYRDGNLERSLKVIAKSYIRTWLVVDGVVVCADWISISFDAAGSGMRMFRMAKMGRVLRIMGVVRMLRFVRVLEEFLERSVSESVRLALRILSITFGIIWITHLMCCTWFMIGKAHTDTTNHWTDFNVHEGLTFLKSSPGYQYMTSFHWAVAQLTLGAIEIPCTNSIERVYNVLCLLLGVIFGSALISSLSATMVELHAMKKDQTQKLRQVRRFIRQNHVDPKLASAVQRQVTVRLGQQAPLTEKDVPALELLSQSLRASLRYSIFEPYILRHPLFRLWSRVDVAVLQHLCADGAAYVFLNEHDDLFSAGTKADVAYFLVEGALEYMQEPGTAPVGVKKAEVVSEGRWLCTAALWSEWIHVGRAVAKTPCKLMTIHPDSIFNNMTRHAVIEEVTMQYGKSFQQRLLRAEPPHAAYPTDLDVPYTEYGELITAMNPETQTAIGQLAVRQLHLQRHWRKQSKDKKLAEEVRSGETVLVEVENGEIRRMVSAIAIQIEDAEGRLLAQISKLEDGKLKPSCQMPEGTPENREPPLETFNRLVSAKLPWLEEAIRLEHAEQEVTVKETPEYGVNTQHHRTVFHATLGLGAATSALVLRAPESASPASLRRGFLQRDVYVHQGEDETAYFAFLDDDEFEELRGGSCQQELKEWIKLLQDLPSAALPVDSPKAEMGCIVECETPSIEGESPTQMQQKL